MPSQLALDHTISNGSETFARFAGVHEDNVRADFALRIGKAQPEDGTFEFVLILSLDDMPNGFAKLTGDEVFAAVEACRAEWKRLVVDHKVDGEGGFRFPFRDGWDFKAEPEHLEKIGGELALAGDNLFRLVFEAGDDPKLLAIGQKVRELLAGGSRYLAITSRVLFLPWSMIYTHPVPGETLEEDGSNWRKEGFWGYQHILQQTPDKIETKDEIAVGSGGLIALSANFDDRIFADPNIKISDEHIAFLGRFAGETFIKRTKKTELARGFTRDRDSLERILYFYCHGHGASGASGTSTTPPKLVLSDASVTHLDFKTWSSKSSNKLLPTSPLVFINACQGGQMTSMFYQSFAVELLRQGAVGLVGAQIDVPAIFASEYASRVLGAFLTKADGGRRRLGPLMRDVNRTLWDDHNNPLGLIYSLYRGVDCFVSWPKT